MNPATFVAGAICGVGTSVAWVLVVLHPPQHHDWWNLVLIAASAGSVALGIGVIAVLVEGVTRG